MVVNYINLKWNGIVNYLKKKKDAYEFIKDETYKTNKILSIPCFYSHDDYLEIVKNILRHKLSVDVSVEIEK
jgi:uncharacterized protein YqgQ